MWCVKCRCVKLYFFFFFKQKTAYEMRISDWSSDVCSSDLVLRDHRQRDQLGVRMFQGSARHAAKVAEEENVLESLVLCEVDMSLAIRPDDLLKIGRASCRERVCQYV